MDAAKRNIGMMTGLAVALVVGVGVYSVLQPSPMLKSGIETGSIEISGKDVNRYFTYVSTGEAQALINESRNNGEFKFIFPQVDLNNIERLEIQSYEKTTKSGDTVTILGIQGLPPETEIYSNIDGTIRASALGQGAGDGQSVVIFTAESDDSTAEYYLPYVPGVNDPSLELEGMIDISLGAPMTKVVDSLRLDSDVFPEGWQMALIIRALDSDIPNGSALINILTKNGKIVMIER